MIVKYEVAPGANVSVAPATGSVHWSRFIGKADLAKAPAVTVSQEHIAAAITPRAP